MTKLIDQLKTISLEHIKKSYLSLVLITKELNSNPDNVDYAMFIQQRFDQVTSNYLNEIFQIRSSIDFQTQIKWEINETASKLNDIQVQSFKYVLYIVNKLVQCSMLEFCSLFVENDGLRLCLEFLKDEDFLNKNKKVMVEDLGIPDYLTMIVQTLANRTCDEQKPKWKSLDAADILLKLGEVGPASLLNSYFTFAYLLDDKQIESLVEQNKMKSILDAFLKILVTASDSYKKNDLDRSDPIEIKLKGTPVKCKILFVDRGDGISNTIDEILVCLFKLAVNDSIKLQIYLDKRSNESFKTILEKGNFFLFIFYAVLFYLKLTSARKYFLKKLSKSFVIFK